MPTLREYDVVIDGIETTLQLTDEDARARGLTVPPLKAAPRRAQNAPRTPNKARTPRTKAAEKK